MKLTVLGCFGPFPRAGGACSGYLVEDGDTKILLDCGNGVMSKVQQICPVEKLTAIILTHLHSDHMSDILVLRYAADVLLQQGLMDKPIKLFASPTPEEEFSRLTYKDAFEITKITQNLELNIEGIRISFSPMTHPYECFAVCLRKENRKLVYSGDTTMNDSIIPFSRDADFLLCDSALLQHQKTPASPHLSAKEVGLIALKANVKRLLLTHFWFRQEISDYLAEASEHYPDPQAAEEFRAYDI